MKYVSEKGQKQTKDGKKIKFNLTAGQLKERMQKAAEVALSQIEEKRYTLKFQGDGSKIYKAALVVGDYMDILVVFKEASNWRLTPGPDGLLRVSRT
jgi:hypothetical protein